MLNVNTTIEQKFSAWCSWVEKITGRPVIKSRRGMNAQLNVPYCAIDLLSAELVEKDISTYVDDEPETDDEKLTEIVRGLTLCRFLVSAIGGADAMQCIHRLNAALHSDLFILFSSEYSFGLSEIEGMQNLSAEFLGAAFENRAQIKVSFYIPVPTSFDVDYFTFGDMEIKINREANNTIETQYGMKLE